jgi:hypothetical protein
MIINFVEEDVSMYDKLLDTKSLSLDWVSGNRPFPTEPFGVKMGIILIPIAYIFNLNCGNHQIIYLRTLEETR